MNNRAEAAVPAQWARCLASSIELLAAPFAEDGAWPWRRDGPERGSKGRFKLRPWPSETAVGVDLAVLIVDGAGRDADGAIIGPIMMFFVDGDVARAVKSADDSDRVAHRVGLVHEASVAAEDERAIVATEEIEDALTVTPLPTKVGGEDGERLVERSVIGLSPVEDGEQRINLLVVGGYGAWTSPTRRRVLASRLQPRTLLRMS